MSKTPGERFLMCAQLYEDAKAIARAALPPGLSYDERERETFKRTHGDYSEVVAARLY